MSFFSNIFSKAKPLSLNGITDWHCHILPGVDDGVESLTESLEILDRYENAGITEVWLTPHIMEDVPNTTDFLRQRFAELQSAYNGSLKLHLAAENMIDKLFLERLDTDDLLPIGDDGKTLLVETSYFSAPLHFYDTLDSIKSKGYFPLLAHPERYNYMDSFSHYRHLREMGVKFQINLMSLCGHYGPIVRARAMRLLAEGYCEHLGTDLHRQEHLDIICRKNFSNKIQRQVQMILNQ